MQRVWHRSFLVSAALEELYSTLVFFGFLARGKGAEVPALAGGWVYLSRVEAVLAGLELADHGYFLSGRRTGTKVSESKWRTNSNQHRKERATNHASRSSPGMPSR